MEKNNVARLSRKNRSNPFNNSVETPEDLSALPPEEILKLVQVLREETFELALLNQELRAALANLQKDWYTYADLYNLAPAGYFILDERGTVREVNLKGVWMLGLERINVIEKPFVSFFCEEDGHLLSRWLQKIIDKNREQSIHLRMRRNDNARFDAHLVAEFFNDVVADETQIRIVVSELASDVVAGG